MEAWIKTAIDGTVKCAHCNCKAGLREVCSNISAILFYVEVQRRVKSYTDLPCQWIMLFSIEAIPFSRIHDLDFSMLKSILLPTKRGAHLNNDCSMICDPSEIEHQHGSSQASNHDSPSVLGFSCNPNVIDISERAQATFL